MVSRAWRLWLANYGLPICRESLSTENYQQYSSELPCIASSEGVKRLWKWLSPLLNGSLVCGVRSGLMEGSPLDRERRPNAGPSKHRYFRRAKDDTCYSQVWPIYSIQSFEFDYISLIFGEDLVWRNEQWMCQMDKRLVHIWLSTLPWQRKQELGRSKSSWSEQYAYLVPALKIISCENQDGKDRGIIPGFSLVMRPASRPTKIPWKCFD